MIQGTVGISQLVIRQEVRSVRGSEMGKATSDMSAMRRGWAWYMSSPNQSIMQIYLLNPLRPSNRRNSMLSALQLYKVGLKVSRWLSAQSCTDAEWQNQELEAKLNSKFLLYPHSFYVYTVLISLTSFLSALILKSYHVFRPILTIVFSITHW